MEPVTKTIKNLISVKGMAAHKLKVWRGNFQAMKAEAKALAAEAPSNVPPIAENSITWFMHAVPQPLPDEPPAPTVASMPMNRPTAPDAKEMRSQNLLFINRP